MNRDELRQAIICSVDKALPTEHMRDFVLQQGGFEKYFQCFLGAELAGIPQYQVELEGSLEDRARIDIAIQDDAGKPVMAIQIGAGYLGQREQAVKPLSDLYKTPSTIPAVSVMYLASLISGGVITSPRVLRYTRHAETVDMKSEWIRYGLIPEKVHTSVGEIMKLDVWIIEK